MKLNIGERIAYSVQFLKSIGESHSEMARARGKIIEIKEFSGGKMKIAQIEWEGAAIMPKSVNIANLAKVGPNSRFCNVG